MTAYHGGKQRIGKKLAEEIVDEALAIADDEDFQIKGYCEPFCGMLGVYQHIPELFEEGGLTKLKYKAGDTNGSLIKMWEKMQKKWVPEYKCSKKCFERLKNDGKVSAKKGFLGFIYSFRGIYFSSYTKRTTQRVKNTIERMKNIAQKLEDVIFSSGKYDQFSNLRGYVIYCDPPYQKQSEYYIDTGKERKRLTFDNDKFFEWCRRMSKHNIVFVSEFKAPKDFDQIWKYRDEKLYVL